MATPMKSFKSKRGRPKLAESERKRRKISRIRGLNEARITIGIQITRWNATRKEAGAKNNADFARILMDTFQKTTTALEGKYSAKKPVAGPSNIPTIRRPVSSSTPGPKAVTPSIPSATMHHQEKEVSGAESLTGQSSISGIQPIVSSETDIEAYATSLKTVKEPTTAKQLPGFSESFLDPFELSIDVVEDEDSDAVKCDEEYDPSFEVIIWPVSQDVNEISFADDCYGGEEESDVEAEMDEEEMDEEEMDEEEEMVEEQHAEPVPMVKKRVFTTEDARGLSEEEFFLCSKDCLMALARTHVDSFCQECSKQVEVVISKKGTAVTFKWTCPDGHTSNTWHSQPILRRGVNSGDLIMAAAVLFSGNNFQKVVHLCHFLNMPFISMSAFNRYQTTYLVPAIEDFWTTHIEEMLSARRGSAIVILGDGRMDSPGYCAQYCTYTAMDNATKNVISVKTVDKRETGRSSVRMEKEAFIRTMEFFEREEMNVVEVVTDAHASIAAHLRKECPHIKHSYDVWHAAKNLAKRIMKAAQEKQCGDLKDWCKHVINHFYHTCDTTETVEEFTGVWFGVLHHVVNEHEWTIDCGSQITSCLHGPLTEERQTAWLSKGSAPHNALRVIVADRRFLGNIPYFLNARSTAELEAFNNLILMYAGKRFAYKPPVYRARCLLAAIDHNYHLQRPTLLNKLGVERVSKVFNKKSGRWLLRPVKAKKLYPYTKDLMEGVLVRRVEDRTTMFKPVQLHEDDPRRISSSIAPVPPPSTDQLRQEQKTRFKELKQ